MTYYDRWAKDSTWTSGPRTGKSTVLVPTQAQAEQGMVGGLSFKCQHVNWALREMGANLNALMFGTGQDGAVVYAAGAHSLTQDVYATTIDIQTGASVEADGHRIFATESITITGDVDVTSYVAESPPTAGVGSGNPGAVGNILHCLGGSGGAAGNGDSGANSGGAGGASALPPLGGVVEVVTMTYRKQGVIAGFQGGAGGGSGGGGTGGTSGAGGRGGHVIFLAAPEIIWNGGSLISPGGAGGNATGGSNGGGGGGGGGGAVVILRRRVTGTPSYTLTAGIAGSSDGTGTNGLAGAAGVAYDIEI